MKDYLNDRCQFVQIDDKMSTMLKSTNGVPQGSILGLFCLIYMWERCQTRLILPVSSLQMTQRSTKIVQWKISAIVSKAWKVDLMKLKNGQITTIWCLTKAKLRRCFFRRVNWVVAQSPGQKCLYYQVKRKRYKSSMKILGMILNENLNWNEHISYLLQSGYSTLKSLKLIKRFYPTSR